MAGAAAAACDGGGGGMDYSSSCSSSAAADSSEAKAQRLAAALTRAGFDVRDDDSGGGGAALLRLPVLVKSNKNTSQRQHQQQDALQPPLLDTLRWAFACPEHRTHLDDLLLHYEHPPPRLPRHHSRSLRRRRTTRQDDDNDENAAFVESLIGDDFRPPPVISLRPSDDMSRDPTPLELEAIEDDRIEKELSDAAEARIRSCTETLNAQTRQLQLTANEMRESIEKTKLANESLRERVRQKINRIRNLSAKADSALQSTVKAAIDLITHAAPSPFTQPPTLTSSETPSMQPQSPHQEAHGRYIYQNKELLLDHLRKEKELKEWIEKTLKDEFGEEDGEQKEITSTPELSEAMLEETDRLTSLMSLTMRQHFEATYELTFAEAKLEFLQRHSSISTAEVSKVKLAEEERHAMQLLESIESARSNVLPRLWDQIAEAEVRTPVLRQAMLSKNERLSAKSEKLNMLTDLLSRMKGRYEKISAALNDEREELLSDIRLVEAYQNELEEAVERNQKREEWLALPELQRNGPKKEYVDSNDKMLLTIKQRLEEFNGIKSEPLVLPEEGKTVVVCSMDSIAKLAQAAAAKIESDKKEQIEIELERDRIMQTLCDAEDIMMSRLYEHSTTGKVMLAPQEVYDEQRKIVQAVQELQPKLIEASMVAQRIKEAALAAES